MFAEIIGFQERVLLPPPSHPRHKEYKDNGIKILRCSLKHGVKSSFS